MSDTATEPAGTEPPVQTGPPPDSPRFNEVVTQRNEARAALETYQAEAAAQIAQLTAAAEAERTRAAQVAADLALAEHGLTDPQARVVARALYGTLPEADRPELPAWVASLKSDPTAAPVALRGYFLPAAPAPAGPPSGSAPAPASGAAGLPSSTPSIATPAPAAGPTAQVDAARKSMLAALKSGDPEAINRAKAEANRALGALVGSR